MRKIFRYPFLCLLTLSVLAAMPSVWRQIGLLEPRPPQRAVQAELPQIRFASLPPALEVRKPVEEPDPEPAFGYEPEEEPEPLPPEPPENPFEGALFVGDSRTVGIKLYSGISDADFFANTGMNVYTVFTTKLDAGGLKDCDLETLLSQKQYQRIYLMLGINELYNGTEKIIQTYQKVVDKLRQLQPDAYIILEANLHVAKKRSDTDKTVNNGNINQLNDAISQLADGWTVFYIDVNPVFDDENGYLTAEYTWDSVHVLGKYYTQWADWLRENTPA